MENISKALLIAGGILLGLLLISLLLNVFNIISDSQKSKEEALNVEQLAKFNAYYESFDKEELYGTDIITVFNKSVEDNKKLDGETITIVVYSYNEDENNYEVTVSSKDDMKYLREEQVVNPKLKKRIIREDGSITYETAYTTRKQYMFKCTNISYYDSGRVQGMTFKELTWNDEKQNWYLKK